ncbi:hypothetical protein [Aquimarina sp. SS2-1]|uniref:hypothetical protein n=1 Tax=Aquimarina besae TaxID=3342247 RepID=UPI00366E8FC2
MKVEYKEYEIEFLNEENYSTKSVDNIRKYKFEYSEGKDIKDRNHHMSKHGIRVRKNLTDELISSAIICEYGGSTTIHQKSFFIDDQKIWICVCDKIYSLKLPNLEIEWFGTFDYATNLSINQFQDDFIIHGELEILRINRKGQIKWRFGARDIFITETGENNFQINNGIIEVQDWEGYKYIIDQNGKEIK